MVKLFYIIHKCRSQKLSFLYLITLNQIKSDVLVMIFDFKVLLNIKAKKSKFDVNAIGPWTISL